MKRNVLTTLTIALLIAFSTDAEAQLLKNLGKKLEQKAETIIDKTLESTSNSSSTTADRSAPQGTKSKSVGPFQNLSKMDYDYVRGTEVIFADDFSKDNIGSMAQHWTSNGRGTVSTVSFAKGQWLELFNRNTYKIKDLVRIPENFTLEFDLLTTSDGKHEFEVDFGFDYEKGVSKHNYLAYQNPVNIQASYQFNYFDITSKEVQPDKKSEVKANMSYFVNDIMKVKIAVLGNMMTTYINDFKVLDTEMIDPETKKYFYIGLNSNDPTAKVYISNVRIDKLL